MARPSTITDEAILLAAREVLLERGLSATTAQIAAHAGISEALVFHRFKTKGELFRAAMDLPQEAPWLASLQDRVGKGLVRRHLEEIATGGIAFFRIIVPLAMMSWSSHPEEPEAIRPRGKGLGHGASHPGGEPPAIRGLKTLASYFEAEMRVGRMARHDAEVLARTFSGALWNYVSMEIMFDGGKRMPLPEGMFVRSFVRLLFEGLDPKKERE